MPHRELEIERICQAALERTGGERAAFLAEACGGDEALRLEVEALLAHERTSSAFLGTPAWEVAAEAIAGEAPALTAGQQVGSYTVVSAIGSGGMGEVYRARDPHLGRDVAIKVLPPTFTRDPGRLARFEREARLLAALNHPNIETIHGIERVDGAYALVLELIDGETVADRLARGPVPPDEALDIARQIADALEAAHDKGIVHRDLKPANIKIRPDGIVKVLDFGIAKAVAGEPSDPNRLRASTLTVGRTDDGMLLGTAAYMSPEQAQGKPVDQRADIWAFGLVLYELLTGRRGFEGQNSADVLVNVMKGEPDWGALPPALPSACRLLLRRCLRKDPSQRLRHIADARFQLEDARGDSIEEHRILPRARIPREWLLWGSVALAVAAGAGVAIGRWWLGRPPLDAGEVRLEITTPPTTDWPSLAISPDGTKVSFVALSEGRSRLWVRSLETGSAVQLNGTDDATLPFWAPNSRSIGFFANGQLKRIDVDTSAVQVIGPAGSLGGAWNQDGTILFSPGPGGPLFSVSAQGRNPTQVTRVTLEANSHRFPQFLPDGRRFLFHAIGTKSGIYLGQLGGPDQSPPRRIIADAETPTYAPSPGRLFFVRQGTLFAQPFDVERLELTGEPMSVAEGVVVTEQGAAALSASSIGHLVYRTAPSATQHEFVWFNRSGQELSTVAGSNIGEGFNSSLSPDGRLLAISVRSTAGTADIWLLDVSRGVSSRFTFHEAFDLTPVFSPDGSRIAFSSNRRAGTDFDLYMKPVAGSGEDERLFATEGVPDVPSDWSRDGRLIVFSRGQLNTSDVWAFDLAARKAFPLVAGEFGEQNGSLSPDGRWIAYQSGKSGETQIYVQPVGRPGPEQLVSPGGGVQVRWRDDGRELFYLAPDDRLMVVPARHDSTADRLIVGTAVPLFWTRLAGATRQSFTRHYTASTDGQRFLVDTTREATLPITVILNWKPGR